MNFIKTNMYLKIEYKININKGPVFNFVRVPNDIQIALRQSVEDYGPETLALFKIILRYFNYLMY